MRHSLRYAILGTLLALSGAPALAGCSRPIITPLAPIGISVIVDGDNLSGVYPKLLQRVGAHAGCTFKTSVVPQARLESMFEMGTADLMMPAVGTPRRNQFGEFIPLLSTRAMLLSVDAKRPAVHDLADLLKRREFRVAVVRGNDYGQAYQAALNELASQGRLYMEADPLRVARLLGAGLADATIMTPMSLAHAMKEDARVQPLLQHLRIEELPELPWSESGIYLSNKSLTAEDRHLLAAQLREGFKADDVWDEYRRYYPANVLAASSRVR